MDNEGQRPEACNYAESALQEVGEEREQRMAVISAELMRTSGRLQAELSERSRLQNLLRKISSCFLQFGADTRENINRLTALCGEVMSADAALYNRLDGGMLIAWGQWNTPAGYNPVSEPEGRICYDLIRKGIEKLYIFNLQESEYARTEPVARDYKLRTYIGRPVRLGNTFVGNLCVVCRDDRVPNDLQKELMGSIATAIAVEEKRRDAEAALRRALSEVEELKNRLQAENTYLQEEIKLDHDFDEIITESDTLRRLLRKVEQVASTDATVLILGETGTGKELVARAIHSLSRRRERPLVKVNCAALPPTLIESELFGHEKGAFTGAFSRKIGRFELADTGTIFLDEVGDLPLDLQAKILRVLQEGEIERVGGTRSIKVDVRVIAATHRNLGEAIKRGAFREDLYYRLNVFPLALPPLRERREDIPLLASHFARKYGTLLGKRIDRIPRRVMDDLQGYDWPGNVRELENIIERAVILTQGYGLQLDEGFELLRRTETTSAPPRSLSEAERQHIERILNETGGKIEGNGGAALRLGLKPSTLRSRMKKLGIKRS